jgi:hypothetical protein
MWDNNLEGEAWTSVVHRGTCLAIAVAMAQVKAAKQKAPAYPPWSPFNNGKYSVAEEQQPEPANTSGSFASGENLRKRKKNDSCC